MTDVRKLASYLRQRFLEERIFKKTGWGKNEIEKAWNEALLDAFLDLREDLPVPDFPDKSLK